MKLNVTRNQLGGQNPEQWLRRAGYALISSREGGYSFVRRLSSGFYPRLHLYVLEAGENITFNFHLDQKRASYEGVTRHSGEYEGPILQAEADRLTNLLSEDLFA